MSVHRKERGTSDKLYSIRAETFRACNRPHMSYQTKLRAPTGDTGIAHLEDDSRQAGAGSDSSSLDLEPYNSAFANVTNDGQASVLAFEDLAPYRQQEAKYMRAMPAHASSGYGPALRSTVLSAPGPYPCILGREDPLPASPFKSDRLQHAISHPVIMVSI